MVCIAAAAGSWVSQGQGLGLVLNTNEWNMGTVIVHGVSDTWLRSPGYFCVSNDGAAPARIIISVSNSTPSGWAAGDRAGTNLFCMLYSPGACSPVPRYSAIAPAGTILTNSLDTNSVMRFDMQFRAPTASEHTGIEQQIQVTVTAQEVE